MRRRLAGLLVVTALLVLGLGAPALGGDASSVTRVYSLSGSATTTPAGGCSECPFFSSVTTGSAACTACLPGDPAGGSFTLSLPTITTYPSNPCRIKTISGTLVINWDNGQTSTANLAGHFEDGKGIARLTGPWASNLQQWSLEQAGIKMNNYPYDPCRDQTNPVSIVLVLSR